jgi:hypothetical protein
VGGLRGGEGSNLQASGSKVGPRSSTGPARHGLTCGFLLGRLLSGAGLGNSWR